VGQKVAASQVGAETRRIISVCQGRQASSYMHRGTRATEREKVVIILEATLQRQDMVFVEYCIDIRECGTQRGSFPIGKVEGRHRLWGHDSAL
jgi:hypothetical protein